MDSIAIAAGALDQGVRVHTCEDAWKRLSIKETKWFELIKPGPNGEPPEIVTFTVGRRRYVTDVELQRFIQKRIAESLKEPASERQKKVAAATKASLRSRRNERAAA